MLYILNALQSFIIALIYHMDLSITTLRLAFKNKCAELLPPSSTQPVCGALFHPRSSPVAPGWGSGACGGGKFSGHLYQTTSSNWVHCLYRCLVKLARSKLVSLGSGSCSLVVSLPCPWEPPQTQGACTLLWSPVVGGPQFSDAEPASPFGSDGPFGWVCLLWLLFVRGCPA